MADTQHHVGYFDRRAVKKSIWSYISKLNNGGRDKTTCAKERRLLISLINSVNALY